MITYQKGSLFDAPPDSVIAHACNCRGKWGSGIAAVFAQRYPQAHAAYQSYCREARDGAIGKALACEKENGHTVVCLFTSRGYGNEVDPPDSILEATKNSVEYLGYTYPNLTGPIHMPKINSGLFKVNWDDTAAILKWGIFDYVVWAQ